MATVGDGFAPLGPPFLPWDLLFSPGTSFAPRENRMGRGQTHTLTDKRKSQLLERSRPRANSVKTLYCGPYIDFLPFIGTD